MMMKLPKPWVAVFLVLVLFTACIRQEGTSSVPGGHRGTVSVTVGFDIPALCYSTRSASVSDESAIRDLCLFLYRNGRLEWNEYRESGAPIVLQLLEGERYSAYAVANAGRQNAPEREEGIHTFVLDAGSVLTGGKIPMASGSGVSFTVAPATTNGTVPAANEIRIELVRLAAKYHFQVDKSALQYGSFTVESVRVCQAARTVEAFGPGSAAATDGDVCDGDYASGGDLTQLNQASAISLFLPENRQGTLLPGNADPWRKEYFDPSLSGVAGLCTYLEVKGHYRDHSGGLNATHTYRMYLGKDATTNFDIVRNTEYTLTLSVSDLGVFRESWKVDRGDVTDTRRLYFDPETVEIASPGEAGTTVVCQPGGVDYQLEWDSASFASAGLDAPNQSGDHVGLVSRTELEEDATAYLKAVSFDGAVVAVCTLRVKAGALPELQVNWDGVKPAYVAQAAWVRCTQVFDGSVLTASVSDPSVARLVRQGDDFRVETLKEGDVTLTFTRTDGNRVSTRTLDLSVAPVYLQVAGQSYRAFADGASNALRIDGGGSETWAMSYNRPRSEFDDALYEELLKPCYTAVKSGSSASVEYFEVSETGLYVTDWSSDIADLPGSYLLDLRPRADIYATTTQPLRRTVIIDAPVTLASGSVFAGENRYYMPDMGTVMTLESTGGVSLSLGSPSSLKLCLAYPLGRYDEGTGYLPCPFETVPATGNTDRILRLTPSYAEMVGYMLTPYRVRGRSLMIYGRLTNARSGRSADLILGNAEIWLDLAVTSKLESWESHGGYDVLDEDHYFIVPCLYSERFEPGIFTHNASEVSAGSSGLYADPPYYIPGTILSEIPDRVTMDGTSVYLSETFPSNRPRPAYLSWQLSDISSGKKCPDITAWLWNDCGFEEEDYERTSYLELKNAVGTWYHRKLYWRLRDPSTGSLIPQGGHIDIPTYGGGDGFSGNYYFRIIDYATKLEEEDFEE